MTKELFAEEEIPHLAEELRAAKNRSRSQEKQIGELREQLGEQAEKISQLTKQLEKQKAASRLHRQIQLDNRRYRKLTRAGYEDSLPPAVAIQAAGYRIQDVTISDSDHLVTYVLPEIRVTVRREYPQGTWSPKTMVDKLSHDATIKE